jgi:hypothetical protein
MPEPKNTLVGLAGQKAWHICVGEAAPRISGKYLPSQLRTQKAGPELATIGRGGGGCGLLLKTLAKNFLPSCDLEVAFECRLRYRGYRVTGIGKR